MNRFTKHSSEIKKSWPKSPKMQVTWWSVLNAVGDGAATTPFIIDKVGPSICIDCDCPGRRVASICRALVKWGLLDMKTKRHEKLATYSLTDFGRYCLTVYSSASHKSQFVVSRKHNLDINKQVNKKNDRKKAGKVNSAISDWADFVARSLVPTGAAA